MLVDCHGSRPKSHAVAVRRLALGVGCYSFPRLDLIATRSPQRYLDSGHWWSREALVLKMSNSETLHFFDRFQRPAADLS